MRLFHGTLAEFVPSILSEGIRTTRGAVVGDEGVFLSATPEAAEYWAKYLFQMRAGTRGRQLFEHDMEDAGLAKSDVIAIIAVDIPSSSLEFLAADMNQAEPGRPGDAWETPLDPDDWRRSLSLIGDVVFRGSIPPEWISGFFDIPPDESWRD